MAISAGIKYLKLGVDYLHTVSNWLKLAAIGFLLLGIGELHAEQSVQWHDLSSKQQQILAPIQQDWSQLPEKRRQRLYRLSNNWESLPAAKRQKIQRRLQKWSRMTPAEKRHVQERHKKFQSLSPEQREKIRKRYRWYKQLPPEKQAEYRELLVVPASITSSMTEFTTTPEPIYERRTAIARAIEDLMEK